MPNRHRKATVAALCVALSGVLTLGCQTSKRGVSGYEAARSSRRHASSDGYIRKVMCLYEQSPWISVDRAGDRDPEGIQFRVFLDAGSGKGVLRDGTFHVEMYQIRRHAPEGMKRVLVSDWHYPVTDVSTIHSVILGMGYHLKLRWAKKSLAGSDIEVLTRFEDTSGRSKRSSTKRFRIPKYVL